MTNRFLHEELYRGEGELARLAETRLTICGAGALGSNLADNLARQGFRLLKLIDRDRVEEHNVGTQIYGFSDVGAWKADVLRNRLFRSVEVEVEAITKELDERTARKFLKGSGVVIDTFDNSASRLLVQEECRALELDCLHAGLFEDYCEVIWDERYRVPGDTEPDVCEYPLARNLVLLAVTLVSETLLQYVLRGERINRSATLRDFAVREMEPGES